MARILALNCASRVTDDLEAKGHEVITEAGESNTPQVVLIGNPTALLGPGQLSSLCETHEKGRQPGQPLILALLPKKTSAQSVSSAMGLPKGNRQICPPNAVAINAAIRAANL